MFTNLCLVMLVAHPCVVMNPSPTAQALRTKLEARVGEYTLSADNFLQALTRIASRFELPMGIEWVREPSTTKAIRLSWRRSTVYKILRSVVEHEPGYRLDVRGEIVHIAPGGALSDPHDFLNLTIGNFEVRDQTVAFASYELHNIVHRATNPPRPSLPAQGAVGGPSTGAGTGASIASGAGDRRVKLSFQGVKVRDILDGLSLAAGFKIWVVSFPEKASINASGFRRATSIQANDAVADEYQPLWEFFRWGQEPSRN